MSVQIEFGDLWTYDATETQKRRPLSSLPESGAGHIHGRLTITVNSRKLPYLGYFGPDDVCFNEWLKELHFAKKTLTSDDPSKYIYDEGEQGQPAFLFERKGDRLFLSIIDSEMSGAPGDDGWKNEEVGLSEFTFAVSKFEESFQHEVLAQNRRAAHNWLSNVIGQRA